MKQEQNMKNRLFLFSGPSGVGGDHLIDKLKKYFPIKRVITTTTRKMRPGEKNGKDYYFISKKEFKKGIKEGMFLEWAFEYNDNYYGVTEKEVEKVKKSKKLGIWRMEYKGIIAVKKLMPELKAILINASLSDLKRRLKKREKENATEEYLKERMEYTKNWLKYKGIYDYEVMNKEGKLDEAVLETVKILKKELNIDK